MRVTQIFQALQEFQGEATACRAAAQAGFLEWAMSLPLPSDAPREARLALLHLEALPHAASAAALFKGYLQQACCQLPRPIRRGGAGARRRRLH